jgi:hypothetical protein
LARSFFDSGVPRLFFENPSIYDPRSRGRRQAHRKAQQQHGEPFGDICQGDYIFCNPDGSPLKPDTVTLSVSLLFRTLKLPNGASHRHGSHLLAAGLPLTECRGDR